MNEHVIKIPCRISELLPEHQVVIIRLINHLASSGDKYKDNVIKNYMIYGMYLLSLFVHWI